MKDQIMEEKNLKIVVKELNETVNKMEKDIFEDADKIQEFKRYMWENKNAMDKQELNSVRSDSESEASLLLNSREYFKKLLRIKDNPYFASITILDETDVSQKIYIGMTYLKNKELNNLIYDWRAPISSIFYDYENGPCSYEAPSGIIPCTLNQKRQYKIEFQKLKRIIDSNLQIEDEVLQEVLSNDSGDLMKNIVTTIQQEQNSVIRNIRDKNLIVQGIAGSGKTSVALHRIAFLLYKIKNLSSENILIFSPNQIFTEYISNVLPELGEENTLQTTFHDYLNKMIPEYKEVESYMGFLKRYYTGDNKNFLITKYKQSDEIIHDIEEFVTFLTKTTFFKNGIVENKVYEYSAEELNAMFHQKYNNLPFFERITQMATKMSEMNYNGSSKKRATYHKLLMEDLPLKKDFRTILIQFYQSRFFKETTNEVFIKNLKNKKIILYEDALVFTYLKGLLNGFFYDRFTQQVVIDEAQDYNFLQYLILSKIFKKASFTILGDINQTINPYYKYDSLELLNQLWLSKFILLNKTYRSSEEIILFTNKILNLDHVCAIRKNNHKPVLIHNKKDSLKKDILYLKGMYKNIAILTRDEDTAKTIYEKLKSSLPLSLISNETKEFKKDFIVLPTYLAKGLEFDSVIVYQDENSYYRENEKNLFYVACTRAQHELILYE